MDPKTESKQPKRWMTLQVGPEVWQVWHRVLLIQFEEPSWQPVDVATCGKLICPTKVPTSVESNYSHAPSQRVHMYIYIYTSVAKTKVEGRLFYRLQRADENQW